MLLAECQRASAPSLVSFVLSKEKQATNSCDCKRSMLEATRCCRTTNATAHTVDWRTEWKHVILKTVLLRYSTTKCALERGGQNGGRLARPRISTGGTYPQKESSMNNTGRKTITLLTGRGIGSALAALFALQSGRQTRE